MQYFFNREEQYLKDRHSPAGVVSVNWLVHVI